MPKMEKTELGRHVVSTELYYQQTARDVMNILRVEFGEQSRRGSVIRAICDGT